MWTIAKGNELAEAGSTAANYTTSFLGQRMSMNIEGLTAQAKNGHPYIFALYFRAGTVMVSVSYVK